MLPQNITPPQLAPTESLAPATWLEVFGRHTPWWIVSLSLHALTICLASLLAIGSKTAREEFVVLREVEVFRPPALQAPLAPAPLKQVLASPRSPESLEYLTYQLSPELLRLTELGAVDQNIAPDNIPDAQTVWGHPLANLRHAVFGNLDPAGGGGTSGPTLEELFAGVGSSSGRNGGWGGGDGGGIGLGLGTRQGSWGVRDQGARELMLKRGGGDRSTENAVTVALRWLAYHQEDDGHWDSMKLEARYKTDTAVTALALLAFLGAGHHEQLGEFKGNVRRALEWLKSKQNATGCIFDPTDAGGHRAIGYPSAIATLALVEAAGMSKVPSTRAAAQKAVDYCTQIHQTGTGSEKLGWRYAPQKPGDLSVTGWFIMALKSAQAAKLHVPPFALAGASQFLDQVEVKSAEDGRGYAALRYAYQPGGKPTARRSAIGALSRQFLGTPRDELRGSVELFMQEGGLPSYGANGEKVDLYYWYYGTLCVFQQQGELWKRWNKAMVQALVENQCQRGAEAGSWVPSGDFSSDWGRAGQTALACLCLEVYYRYALMER